MHFYNFSLSNFIRTLNLQVLCKALNANFKQLFKGKELKDAFWGAAYACVVEDWQSYMNQMTKIEPKAHDWLMRESPTTWSRAHFSTRSKSDMLCNNISESFNQYIKESRDKPIITMLEMIRRQLMTRFQKKKEQLVKCCGSLCPRISILIEELKKESRDLEVIFAGNGVFEVTHAVKTYTVNLTDRTCSCRKWDLTGIPCSHGIASIMIHNGEVSDYVHKCYFVSTWRATYSHMIYPIPDESMWVRTPYDQLMPPPLRRPPGRPKKLRNKALDEPQNPHQVRRFHQSLRCKNCGEIGHNIRTCKGPVKPKKKVFHVGGRGNRAGGSSGAGGRGNRGTAVNVGGRGRGVAGAGSVGGRGMGGVVGRGRGRGARGAARGATRGAISQVKFLFLFLL